MARPSHRCAQGVQERKKRRKERREAVLMLFLQKRREKERAMKGKRMKKSTETWKWRSP